MKKKRKFKVMFVCLGNICRSPLAHAVFSEMLEKKGLKNDYLVESAGTSAYHQGEQADARMRETARAHGVEIDHKARQLQCSKLDEYDLILAMDRHNLEEILKLAGNERQKNKVRLFREFDFESNSQKDVPDPYFGGRDGFETVFSIVERTVESLIEEIEEKMKDGPRTA